MYGSLNHIFYHTWWQFITVVWSKSCLENLVLIWSSMYANLNHIFYHTWWLVIPVVWSKSCLENLVIIWISTCRHTIACISFDTYIGEHNTHTHTQHRRESCAWWQVPVGAHAFCRLLFRLSSGNLPSFPKIFVECAHDITSLTSLICSKCWWRSFMLFLLSCRLPSGIMVC